MRKDLKVDRDTEKKLKITISDKALLGSSRDELPLSAGEQNFLSLTMEFLRAKNSTCPIIVIDDPISSFDSIYKNKLAFSILSILHNKERVILTHNLDLIRLLDSHRNKCYKFYLFSKTVGTDMGFMEISCSETEMLISLERLLNTFRKTIFPYVKNSELFLMSTIPFMRGYAHILGDESSYNNLCLVMHGYHIETVDIAQIYNDLFHVEPTVKYAPLVISVSDIIVKLNSQDEIIDRESYPLLDRTLRHSLSYLILRLIVENELVAKFGINTSNSPELGAIIDMAFPANQDYDTKRKRMKLTTKKSLINEFNHFEGNLSIFQPAIDITEDDLIKEIRDVQQFIFDLHTP